MIPEWLSEKDNYIPKEEKNLYIEKSIFSLIKIISIIRQNKSQDKLIIFNKSNLKSYKYNIKYSIYIYFKKFYLFISNRYICFN